MITLSSALINKKFGDYGMNGFLVREKMSDYPCLVLVVDVLRLARAVHVFARVHDGANARLVVVFAVVAHFGAVRRAGRAATTAARGRLAAIRRAA